MANERLLRAGPSVDAERVESSRGTDASCRQRTQHPWLQGLKWSHGLSLAGLEVRSGLVDRLHPLN